MGKCLLTGTVLVRKLNLKSTRQIMVVIIIDCLFPILISVKMCSVQIRNAVLCLLQTLYMEHAIVLLVLFISNYFDRNFKSTGWNMKAELLR